MDERVRDLEREVAVKPDEAGPRLALLRRHGQTENHQALHEVSAQAAAELPLHPEIIRAYHEVHGKCILFAHVSVADRLVLEALVDGERKPLREERIAVGSVRLPRDNSAEGAPHRHGETVQLFETADDVFLARVPGANSDAGFARIAGLQSGRMLNCPLPGDFGQRVSDIARMGDKTYVLVKGDVTGMPPVFQSVVYRFGAGDDPELDRGRGYWALSDAAEGILGRVFGTGDRKGSMITWMMPYRGRLYFCDAVPEPQQELEQADLDHNGPVVAFDTDAVDEASGPHVIRAHDLFRKNEIYPVQVKGKDGSRREFSTVTEAHKHVCSLRKQGNFESWNDSPFARRTLDKRFQNGVVWTNRFLLRQNEQTLESQVVAAVPISRHRYNCLQEKYSS